MPAEHDPSPPAPFPPGRDADIPPPAEIWIRPDFDGLCTWGPDGSLVDISLCWPDLPGIGDLRERLEAWADAYDRHARAVSVPVLEAYGDADAEAALLRGRALAEELARLLGPCGVQVRFFGGIVP